MNDFESSYDDDDDHNHHPHHNHNDGFDYSQHADKSSHKIHSYRSRTTNILPTYEDAVSTDHHCNTSYKVNKHDQHCSTMGGLIIDRPSSSHVEKCDQAKRNSIWVALKAMQTAESEQRSTEMSRCTICLIVSFVIIVIVIVLVLTLIKL